MNLTYRRLEERDVPKCFEVQEPDAGMMPSPEFPRIVSSCLRIFRSGALTGIVLEDLDRPPADRMVGSGASVFVTAEFMEELRRNLPSSLPMAVFLGDHEKILKRHAIARANATTGISAVVVLTPVAPTWATPEEIRSIHGFGPITFLFAHQGYRLREILFQPPRGTVEFCLASGFLRRMPSAASNSAEHIPNEFVGITRDEAFANPGCFVAQAFLYHPPRLGFKMREQDVLLRALQGETDPEIARSLKVAMPTVKTYWRQIYERVLENAKEIITDGTSESTDVDVAHDTDASVGAFLGDPARGPEKRRRLLQYLQRHPEELRPFETSS